MKVKVLIPFHFSAENKDCVPDDEIEVTYEQYMNIKSINVNMVEVVEEEKPKKTKAKKKRLTLKGGGSNLPSF